MEVSLRGQSMDVSQSVDRGQSVDGGLDTWSDAGILRTVYRVLVTSTAGVSVDALPPLVGGLGDG